MRLFIRICTRALTGVALFGALATSALADVSPAEGTIGTEFTATFEGDLGNKPKIELSYQEQRAKAPKTPKAVAKVLSVDGGTVTFVIQAAKGGGDFSVGVKGSDEVSGSLRLREPEVASADKATVPAGEELVLTGDFFGDDSNKRNAPKVFVNGKKAKTRAFTATTLTIQLHKSTSAGLADITIQNKIGESTFNGVVTVTVPPKPIKGPDSLSMNVGGKKVSVKFTKKDPEAVVAVIAVNRLQISMAKVSGNDPRKGIKTQQFTLNMILPTSLESLELPAVFNPADGAIWTDQFIKGLPPTGTVGFYTNEAGGNINVTITGRSGNRISGTFSGSLNKASGDGPGSVSFTEGEFVVTVEQ